MFEMVSPVFERATLTHTLIREADISVKVQQVTESS